MNSNKTDELKDLQIDKIISLIFIITSILEIIGTEYKKDFIITNNKMSNSKANDIFIMTIVITIIIYFYFLYKGMEEYKNSDLNKKELYKINITGILLQIIGTFLIFYFQINSNFFVDEPTL